MHRPYLSRSGVYPLGSAVLVADNLKAMGATSGLRAVGVGAEEPIKIDGRSARQWVEAAAGYCRWRSGSDWRHMYDRAERFDQTRLDYLDAASLLYQALYHEDSVGIAPALPVLNPAPPADPRAAGFAAKPRAELVKLLMAADPSLTNPKLLAHLQLAKLAGMLCARLDRAAIEVEGVA